MIAKPPVPKSPAIAALQKELVQHQAELAQHQAELAERDVKLAALTADNRRLNDQNLWLRERVNLIGAKIYTTSSEATREQLALTFNEAEAQAVADAPEPVIEEITYRRPKGRGKREADLSGLATEEVHYELPEDQRICGQCSGPLHEIGTEDCTKLHIVPAKVTAVKHLRHKYGCRHCQCHGTSAPVVTAAMPPMAFPKSLASPSLVAHLMVEKYQLAVPLYRQEQHLKSLGIAISRQNMSNWMLAGASLLTPVYDHLHKALRARDILHADETRLQVLHEKDREPTGQSRMWLYCTGRDGPAIALYDYQETRGAIHPLRFLADYKGYLHVDGYAAYEKLPGVTLVGCWAHARRKFDEVLRTVKPDENQTKGLASWQGLQYCNQLFAIERELRDLTPDARLLARRERSAPLLAEFKAWLQKTGVEALPKMLVGKAIAYCLTQWDKLTAFLKDGRLEIDNNRAERAIKPFVIGRKNWLFCNTPNGANASATIYSIVETAKANGLVPATYLEFLLERLPSIQKGDSAELDSIMPWHPTPKAFCTP